MRFTHPDGTTVHLAYCTNVHPAETLEGVLAQLAAHCEPVRRRLGVDRLGVGLWLAADAVRALTASPAAVGELRGELERRGLEVVTLNGFPYSGFGGRHVKHRVYQPDWTHPERLAHTLALAGLLARLLPDDAAGGTISTLPLAWRTGFDAAAAARARTALTELAAGLDRLHDQTGRSIQVAVEPEPGCVVETTADAARWLAGLPAGRIGVCLDTCHLATSFEDPATALAGLDRAGIAVTKVQISAALHAADPADAAVRAALAAFDEPRFLHQTRARHQGRLLGTDDLGPALAPPPPASSAQDPATRTGTGGTGGPGAGAEEGPLPRSVPWRSHFHVPLTSPPSPPLSSTLDVTTAAVGLLLDTPAAAVHHLEVETYTWQALPAGARPTTDAALADGIAAELAFARDLLTGLGLKEQP
ncbi:metabolite traffic protein EboE [Actinacidiphila acidipaludis]|uniref:Metabolite traffic protein EboE n=1 Tax=Actinacidiphila acidipaludis TaxID=2873382 RepID=A0ABS7QGU3_9ACTN|nr:metabolite traffic protein EboE [Streptomyces acidipaludis]MBY8882387.1 metabolite traffic protein EboE [Streptomyces acidipaludis]